MNSQLKAVVSCGAVVWKLIDGKFCLLLVKPFKKKEVWGIPKGHVEDGESFIDCAHREVFEETGLRVKLGIELPIVSTIYKDESKQVYSWLAEPVDLSAVPVPQDGENDRVEFISIDELPRIHIYQQPLIKYVIDLLHKQ